MRRAVRWLGCLWIVTVFPLLALSVLLPDGSVLGWIFALLFWPGPLLIALAYIAIRGVRHRRIHRQFDPCPWCLRERERETLPQATRDARDRLRERLTRSEMHD